MLNREKYSHDLNGSENIVCIRYVNVYTLQRK